MTAHPPAAGSPTALAAAQAALAAEEAAVFGYGVVGARVGAADRADAQAAYGGHRSGRDAMHRAVIALGGDPVPAEPAYVLPFAVPDAAAARRLAALLEDRVAEVYADLVGAAAGRLRQDAAAALAAAAVRAVRWRGGSGVAFPGLPERTPDGPSAPAT